MYKCLFHVLYAFDFICLFVSLLTDESFIQVVLSIDYEDTDIVPTMSLDSIVLPTSVSFNGGDQTS